MIVLLVLCIATGSVGGIRKLLAVAFHAPQNIEFGYYVGNSLTGHL